MSATNSSAAVARSQAKRHRSALDSLKRVLPERSAKLTAGLTIVIAMVLFAIIVITSEFLRTFGFVLR